MKTLITAIAAILLLTACEAQEQPQTKTVEQIKHDAPPVNFQGSWSSLHDNEAIVVIEADNLMLDLTDYGYWVFRSEGIENTKAEAVGDRMYTIYLNGLKVGISNGVGEYEQYITITIDGLCITRLRRYVPEPQQPVNNITPM